MNQPLTAIQPKTSSSHGNFLHEISTSVKLQIGAMSMFLLFLIALIYTSSVIFIDLLLTIRTRSESRFMIRNWLTIIEIFYDRIRIALLV